MIFLKYIATLGFVGYLPLAPGSFGSLVALALFILLKPPLFLHIIILPFITSIGVVSSHYAEKLLGSMDSRHIVIDEFCGYLFCVAFLPFSYSVAIIAFFLFRFFDILKPFPIRKIESILSGGIGIMADDMLAALYTNVILHTGKFIMQIL